MKQKILYKLMICLLVVIMVTQTNPLALAHSISQEGILAKTPVGGGYTGYYIGGDNVGWSIDEDFHTNGASLTYHFSNSDSYLSSQYKAYVTNGASKWSGTVTITQKSYGSGTGEICTFYNASSGVYAAFDDYKANSSGHLTSWKIMMNRARALDSTILAHEFGHAIGLNDLYGSQSTGKLMYGYISGTATGPTTSDKWGAKVITGVHSTHTWGYKYYGTGSDGNYHVKYCTQCRGLSVVVEKCTYNADNVCRICGTPKGAGTYSLDNPVSDRHYHP